MHKRIIVIIIISVLICAIGLSIFLFAPRKPFTHFLIEHVNDPIPGKIVTPKTTEELGIIFADAEINAVPRIFITAFPSDFKQNNHPVLFTAALTPLILRANEQTMRERIILQILDEKLKQQKPLSKTERAFFDQMAIKYDALIQKTDAGRMADLLDKVDKIPVSLAIVQAGLQTDFGLKNWDTPFGQKEWIDGVYQEKHFDSLIEATDSYVRDLNATIPYFQWRFGRKLARPFPNYKNAGSMFSKLLKTYDPDDPLYTQKLRSFYTHFKIGSLDEARFK